MRDTISTDERARRRPLRVVQAMKPSVRGVPSLMRVSSKEAWLQVGDRYVIVEIPNRLYGIRLTEEGEAV